MMRHCRLPLVVSFECKIAAHLHLTTVQVRRAPLPLVLLWLNYAAQADGMETWWLDEAPARQDAAGVREKLASLRAQADDLLTIDY
jgi:hypothetical protein